jgi:hypothetical protein
VRWGALTCAALAALEFLGTLFFWPWVYRLGLCIWRESRCLHAPTAGTGETFETATGRFVVVEPGVCRFRWKRHLSGSDAPSPFAIKGTLRWQGDQVTVEGRMPVFPLLFVCFALAVYVDSIWALYAANPDGSLVGAAFAVLVVVGVAIGVCLFLIHQEVSNAKRALRECWGQTEQDPSDARERSIDQFGQIHRNSGSDEPDESGSARPSSVDEFGQIHRTDDSRRRPEATEADHGGHR